jgi:hypothetical protein
MLPKKTEYLPGGWRSGDTGWNETMEKKDVTHPATDPVISTGGLEDVGGGAGRNPVRKKPIKYWFVEYLSIIIMYFR